MGSWDHSGVRHSQSLQNHPPRQAPGWTALRAEAFDAESLAEAGGHATISPSLQERSFLQTLVRQHRP